jgi:hypothetical protein
MEEALILANFCLEPPGGYSIKNMVVMKTSYGLVEHGIFAGLQETLLS